MPSLNNEKHDRILKAALKVFAQNGFYHSKVSAIAKEASVADGTIYLYFKNKDDILISIFEESMEHFLKEVQSQLASIEDPVEKIQQFIRFHLQILERNQFMAEVIQVELRQSHKFMKEYVPEKFFEYLDLLASVIEEGQQAGVIKKSISPPIAKRIIFGALDEISLHQVLSKSKKFDVEDAVYQLSEILLNGICA